MGDAPIDPNAATLASDSDVVTSPDALPVSLGSYEILRELGRGGMGSVYLGKRSGPGGFLKLVAIKRIHPHLAKEAAFVTMFLDEARVAASIQHANVAQVFELKAEQGQYLLIMEYVHGVTLDELLRASESGLPIEVALTIASGALAGLHAAHTAKDHLGNPLNLVHRDATPHNIFLTFEGDVKLSDFGVARAEGRLTKTETGRLKGKAAYMSPEQLHGREIDARLDIFSIGVVLWEMLTARRLFVGESQAQIMMNVVTGKAPAPSELNPDVSPELDALVRKALSPEPDERFQSAREMQVAIDALRAHDPDAQKAVAEAIARRMPDAKPERDAALTTRRDVAPPVQVPSQSGVQLSAPKASSAHATDPDPAPRSRAGYGLATLIVLALGVGGTWLALQPGSDPVDEPRRTAVETRASMETTPVVEDMQGDVVDEDDTESGVVGNRTEGEESDEAENGEGERIASSMRRTTMRTVMRSDMRVVVEASAMATMQEVETPMRAGRAFLNFIPTRAAEVFIDGRSYGWTPMRRKAIPSGDVVLVLRPRDGEARRVTIHAEPGEVVTVPRDTL